MSTLTNFTGNAALSDGRENSLRINVTFVIDCGLPDVQFTNCGAGTLFVEANVEFRLTANATTPMPQWLSYGKLSRSFQRHFCLVSKLSLQASTPRMVSWTKPAETSRSTP
jgi:hypothetical protein